MKYKNIIPALFVSRPNRFIAIVLVDGEERVAHVKNTGRCRELLVPGCRVYLSVSSSSKRKTAYDLITVEKQCETGTRLINMDSQAPNDVVCEWLKSRDWFDDGVLLRREYTLGESRFDFLVEKEGRRALIEVKGVTLEDGGVARFPDAPTERGRKHLLGLAEAVKHGYECYVFFVIQMKGVYRFEPNRATDPAFSDALNFAVRSGVRVIAMDANVTSDEISIDLPVPVTL